MKTKKNKGVLTLDKILENMINDKRLKFCNKNKIKKLYYKMIEHEMDICEPLDFDIEIEAISKNNGYINYYLLQ